MTEAQTTKRRTYDEGCATAHALDLVGERWALLVVRELLLGPKRFTDLRGGLPGVSPNVLAERLRGLEGVGVVRRRRLPPPAASGVYELTEWGEELEPVVSSLGRWGARSPSRFPDTGMSADALILSLRTMFDRRAAGELEASFELRLSDDCFHAEVACGRFEISRGEAESTDATIESSSDTLAALVYGERGLEEALRSGGARIGGSRQAVERFLTLFPLPERAADAPGS